MAWSNEEFTEVFNALYPGLCRFLESMVGRTGLGQELAQETFLRLYKNRPAHMPNAEARFWVYRVGRNLALNEVKRAGTWRGIKERLAAIWAMKQQEHINRSVRVEARAENTLAVYRLLEELPEHQRAALLLREVEEMSYQEIAQVLNISESKVKVDIHRARTVLRRTALRKTAARQPNDESQLASGRN